MAESFEGLLEFLATPLFRDHQIQKENLEIAKMKYYSTLSDEEFMRLISTTTTIVKAMALSDMDAKQVDAFLMSQTKRKDKHMEEWQVAIFSRFWKANRNKIHSSIVNSVQWNNKSEAFTWTANVIGGNVPVAVLSLQCENENNKESVRRIITFHVTEDEIEKMMLAMNEIERKIQQLLCLE